MIKIISILNLCWEHIFSLHWSHLAKTHHNPAWLWWCKSRINMSFHWRFFSGLNYVLGIFSLPSSNQFRASFYEPGSKVYSVTFMNKMSLLFFVLKVEPIEVGKKINYSYNRLMNFHNKNRVNTTNYCSILNL